jgi:hypothetical protein
LDASWIVSSSTSASGGIGFFRQRLVLICKVLAGINVGYFALFVLALWLDSGRDVLTLVQESFSAETLGEYLLLGGIAAGCHFGPQSLRALRVLDATWILGLGVLWASERGAASAPAGSVHVTGSHWARRHGHRVPRSSCPVATQNGGQADQRGCIA